MEIKTKNRNGDLMEVGRRTIQNIVMTLISVAAAAAGVVAILWSGQAYGVIFGGIFTLIGTYLLIATIIEWAQEVKAAIMNRH